MAKMNTAQQNAASAIEAMVRAGATQAQCVLSSEYTHDFRLESGQVTLLRTLGGRQNLALKAFFGTKVGQFSMGIGSSKDIDYAAHQCVTAAAPAMDNPYQGMNVAAGDSNLLGGGAEIDKALYLERLRELAHDAKALFPRASLKQVFGRHYGGVDIYLNTHGVQLIQPKGYYSLFMMMGGVDGTQLGTTVTVSANLHTLEQPLSAHPIIRQALETSEKTIRRQPFGEKKTGTLVLTPGSLNYFMQMAMGAFAGELALISGTSRWQNRLGEAVASEPLSMMSAPNHPELVGARRFTDEGFVCAEQPIIQNGTLRSLLCSLYAANKTGLPRGASPGGSLVVAPGEAAIADIISGIKDGILMHRFSGGFPQTSGDFSGVAKNSFIIRNGEIIGAADSAMVSGNLADILMNLRGLSRETLSDGSFIMPYAAFDGITIQ